MTEVASVLLYVGYILGTFKIVAWVERWPDGKYWALLGFVPVILLLALLSAAWWVISGT